jgi:asparagine synthase (glutamine-hydrolysing)
LDQTLVEFLMSIPLSQLLRPGERRSLMRRALHGILPDKLLLRTTKAGAARSLVLTVHKEWSLIEEHVLKDMLIARLGLIDLDRFSMELVSMRHGTVPDQVVTLIKAIALEVWLKNAVAHSVVAFPRSAAPV